MPYAFGSRSRANLNGVDPRLVAVATRALELTARDFTVIEGLRSRDRQAALVAKGASQTMQSKHITGKAIDVIACAMKGSSEDSEKIAWDFAALTEIAEAFRLASIELSTPITWGAAWRRALHDCWSAREAYNDYLADKRASGGAPFIDSPHFELAS